jgi:hypothetical protein
MNICATCNVVLQDLPDVKYIGKVPVCPKGHNSKRVFPFWTHFLLGIFGSFVFLIAGSMNSFGLSRTGATLLWLLPLGFIFVFALLEGLKYYRKPEPTRKLAKQSFGLALGIVLPLGIGIVVSQFVSFA